MDPKTVQKLDALRKYWYNDDYSLKWLDDVEKEIRRLMALEDLKKNKSVSLIIKDAESRISAINKLLTYDRDMTLEVRNILIRERDVHEFWLDRFDGRNLSSRLEMVDKILEEELKSTGIIKNE